MNIHMPNQRRQIRLQNRCMLMYQLPEGRSVDELPGKLSSGDSVVNIRYFQRDEVIMLPNKGDFVWLPLQMDNGEEKRFRFLVVNASQVVPYPNNHHISPHARGFIFDVIPDIIANEEDMSDINPY